MLRISPVKLIAGIAAVVLSVAGVFFASEARQGVVNMFSVIRLSSPKPAQPPRQTEVSATPSGVKVIPIGVAPQARPASAASAGKAHGG